MVNTTIYEWRSSKPSRAGAGDDYAALSETRHNVGFAMGGIDSIVDSTAHASDISIKP
jgi:hypothetical protein